jgi:hypothetical protein
LLAFHPSPVGCDKNRKELFIWPLGRTEASSAARLPRLAWRFDKLFMPESFAAEKKHFSDSIEDVRDDRLGFGVGIIQLLHFGGLEQCRSR